jgi:hypothetical protein
MGNDPARTRFNSPLSFELKTPKEASHDHLENKAKASTFTNEGRKFDVKLVLI